MSRIRMHDSFLGDLLDASGAAPPHRRTAAPRTAAQAHISKIAVRLGRRPHILRESWTA
jgi:hypothetical protein